MMSDPRDTDQPVVPGLAPADGGPVPSARRSEDGTPVFKPEEHRPRVLGAADDPDRFDPDRADTAAQQPPTSPRVDRAQDPDRYLPPGQGQSLTELLGPGAHEDERDNWQWAFGLLGVVAFLALVAFLFGTVLSP
jgi:hypothetical protein